MEITKESIDNANRIGQEPESEPKIMKGTNSGIIIIAFKKIVLLAPSVSALTKFAMKTIPNEPMNKFINICMVSE